MTRVLLLLFLIVTPTLARAATCDGGYYLSDGECVACPAMAYCPGDDMAYECNALWSGDTSDVKMQIIFTTVVDNTTPDGCICTFQMPGNETVKYEYWRGKCSVGPTEFYRIRDYDCRAGYYATDVISGNATRCAPCTNAPDNTEYTSCGGTDLNDCPWKCVTGYQVNSAGTACDKLCTAGYTSIRTSTGLKIPLYADKRTTPSINIKTDGNPVCYADLYPGTSDDAINFRYNDTTFHAKSLTSNVICDAGYYLNDGVCDICKSKHYCPGNNSLISCATTAPVQPGIEPPLIESYSLGFSKPEQCQCSWMNLSDETKDNYRVINQCSLGVLNKNIYVKYSGCRIGHYAIRPKTSTEYGDCAPCTNGPEHSRYTSYSTPSVPRAVEDNCPWECDDGYTLSDDGASCIPVEQ